LLFFCGFSVERGEQLLGGGGWIAGPHLPMDKHGVLVVGRAACKRGRRLAEWICFSIRIETGECRLGGVELRVAEHLLDEALEHQRGHGVAEEMASSPLSNPRRLHVVADDFAEPVGAQRAALHR